MRRLTQALMIAVVAAGGMAPAARGACCYFAAKDKDVNQPGQKAFITWDPEQKRESFTVQPKFQGNAEDFGMVIPTPSRPKLDEMPRDLFKELAVFTILEPMDLGKYKQLTRFLASSTGATDRMYAGRKPSTVKVLEAGVVGSLDYKIITAEEADDLFQWLRENKYSYGGDQDTLKHYIQKKWVFTTMKIDPKQMKKRADGSYEGEITPTRFAFESDRLVYPAKITKISVKDRTEALFYVQAPQKMDLPEDFSYEPSFVPMWNQALGYAIPEKVTAQEKQWQAHTQGRLDKMNEQVQKLAQSGRQPASLEWAKRITDQDVSVLTGERAYDREAPKEDVEKLKLLKGVVKKGQFITKIRKSFARDELNEDLVFVRARVGDHDDDIEHFSILPTSPP